MQIKSAIGAFFVEFSKFETNFVGMALRALSRDPVFVEQAEQLLDLDARLTLLERMAFARGISATLMTELSELLMRTRKLREQRDEVARALVVLESESTHARPLRARGRGSARLGDMKTLLTPSLERIEAYSLEAIDLQNGLRAFAEKLAADA